MEGNGHRVNRCWARRIESREVIGRGERI
jgi:hypothetical protein